MAPQPRGECDMKMGSTILLIVAVFIAFGYAISDDFQVRNDLSEAKQRLNSCQNAVLNGQQIISELENQNTSLIISVSERENEITELNVEITRLSGENATLEQENSSLQKENLKLMSNQNKEPLIENDQIVLAGIVMAQVLVTLFYKGRKLGLKKIKNASKTDGEYVYLTIAERAQLVNWRRTRK
jgi:septal ring factor EnvC (AmiA/AmiB activator)